MQALSIRHPEVAARSAALEGWTATVLQQPGRRPSRLVRFAHSHLRVTGIERARMAA
jgi:hypothetical protein